MIYLVVAINIAHGLSVPHIRIIYISIGLFALLFSLHDGITVIAQLAPDSLAHSFVCLIAP